MIGRAALLGSVLLGASCDGAPGSLAECDEASCYRVLATELAGRDPAALARQLAKLEDELARMTVVDAVATAHPEAVEGLCPSLPRGEAALRCKRLSSRAHLLRIPVEADAKGDQGDTMTGLPIPHPSLSPELAQLPAEEVPCELGLPRRSCQMTAAAERAQEGRADRAAATCTALDDATWRSECMFRSAEAMQGALGMEAIEGQVELCVASGAYASRCLEHLVLRFSTELAPRRDPKDWARLAAARAQVAAAFGERDAVFTAAFQEQLTARSVHRWYTRTATPTGNPLDHLPAEAAHHVRASLGVLVAEANPDAPLDELTTLLMDALEDRSEPSASSDGQRTRTPKGRRIRRKKLWGLEPDQDPGHPTAYWLGSSHRVVAEDLAADAAICALEAAAHLPTPSLPLLEQGLAHEDPAVRWTAARLLLLLGPDQARRAALAASDDPAIQALAETLAPRR